MTDKQSLLPALWGVSKKLLLLVPEVWVLFVTQLIHPGLTETVCTYLIPKYSGLGAGRWLPGRGWGLRSTPPNSGKKHWLIVGTQEKVSQRAGVGGWHTEGIQPHRGH